MALQRTRVTVELDVLHRGGTTPEDVTSDLQKILNGAAARGLLQEQKPYRHVTGGTWWANNVTVTTAEPVSLEGTSPRG